MTDSKPSSEDRSRFHSSHSVASGCFILSDLRPLTDETRFLPIFIVPRGKFS